MFRASATRQQHQGAAPENEKVKLRTAAAQSVQMRTGLQN